MSPGNRRLYVRVPKHLKHRLIALPFCTFFALPFRRVVDHSHLPLLLTFPPQISPPVSKKKKEGKMKGKARREKEEVVCDTLLYLVAINTHTMDMQWNYATK